MTRIHQTWHCQGNGKVMCMENKEQCGCDGMAEIKKFEKTFDIKPNQGGCVTEPLIKKCGPNVVLKGESTEKVSKDCNKNST